VASEGAGSMPHSKDGGISDRRLPATPVADQATPKDGDRRLPATPVGEQATPKGGGSSEKPGQSAKEDRGRRGRPGRGIDE
jgi:hypothetical protein